MVTDITWVKQTLSDESHRIRSDRSYTNIVEDSRMDAHIIDGVLEKLARVYGFLSFDQMNRFMTPDTKVKGVVYVGQDHRKPEGKGPDR